MNMVFLLWQCAFGGSCCGPCAAQAQLFPDIGSQVLQKLDNSFVRDNISDQKQKLNCVN